MICTLYSTLFCAFCTLIDHTIREVSAFYMKNYNILIVCRQLTFFYVYDADECIEMFKCLFISLFFIMQLDEVVFYGQS